MELASGIGGLLAVVTSSILSLNNIIGKYGMLDDTAPLIVSDCEDFRRCLNSIRDKIRQNPQYATDPECQSILNTTLAGCDSIFKILSSEIKIFSREMVASGRSSLSRRQKLRIVWNWDTLQHFIQQMNRQKESLRLVLQIIQNNKIDLQNRKLDTIQQLLLLDRDTLALTAQESYMMLLDQRSRRNQDDLDNTYDQAVTSFSFPLQQPGTDLERNSNLTKRKSQLRIEAVRNRDSIGLRVPNVLLPTVKLSSEQNSIALDIIFTALEKRDYQELERLCHFTDHSLRDKRGHTILSAAAHLDDLVACKIIIRHGSGLEARCSLKHCRGCRPIHIAAMNDSVELLQLLLEQNVNHEATSQFGRIALHWAAEYDCVNAYHLLTTRGPSWTTTDAEGDNVLHIAARSHSLNILTFIRGNTARWLFRSQLRIKNNLGQSPIQLMIDTDWEDAVKLVIMDVADPEATLVDCGNLNWLFYAAYEGAHRTMTVLMRHGLKADVFDSCGYTPAHYAVLSNGNAPKTLRTLCHNGSNFVARRTPAPQETTPRSTRGRRHRIPREVKPSHSISNSEFTNNELRAAQSKLHEHDGSEGLTVLHLAAEAADVDVVKELLLLDVEVDMSKSCGCDALKLARKNSDPQVFLAILQHIFDPESTRESKIQMWANGEFQALALALACASKQDFNKVYGRFRSAKHLHLDANCECGPFSLELLKCVLRQGASPVDANGYLHESPLLYSVTLKNFDAVSAIAEQYKNATLQPAEKDFIHRALLFAETHNSSFAMKQVLRDLCPEIAADVQTLLDQREAAREEERRTRERIEEELREARREKARLEQIAKERMQAQSRDEEMRKMVTWLGVAVALSFVYILFSAIILPITRFLG